MKIVVILPCREEFLAFEILKSLVKHGAEIYCSSLEIIKNMLILSNQGLEIGIENLEKCKICNDFEKFTKLTSKEKNKTIFHYFFVGFERKGRKGGNLI